MQDAVECAFTRNKFNMAFTRNKFNMAFISILKEY